jgi:hypothetical protein
MNGYASFALIPDKSAAAGCHEFRNGAHHEYWNAWQTPQQVTEIGTVPCCERPGGVRWWAWSWANTSVPVLDTPPCGGLRLQGAAERRTQNMPLRTRRSSTRGMPCGLFGSIGLMTPHSQSLSSYRMIRGSSFGSFNRGRRDAINREPTLPGLPANRTCRGHGRARVPSQTLASPLRRALRDGPRGHLAESNRGAVPTPLR